MSLEDDARVITHYCNTLNPEDVLRYLEDNYCIVENAWLESVRQQLERQIIVSIMTAYATARGEVTSFVLKLPEVEDD